MRVHAFASLLLCAFLYGDAQGEDPAQRAPAPDATRKPIDWSRLRVGRSLAREPDPVSANAFHEWTFDFRRALSALFISWRTPQTVTGESEEAWFIWFDRKRNASRVLHLHAGTPTSEGDAWTDEAGRVVLEYPVEDAAGNLRWSERVQFGALGAGEPYEVVRTFRRPDGGTAVPRTTHLTPVADPPR
jgi:hypothetical protein